MPNSKIIRTTPEAQGDSAWKPPAGTLGELVRLAWQRAARLESGAGAIDSEATVHLARPSLRHALTGAHVGVIAEIKRSSPSRGAINPGLDSARQARAYSDGGAVAISVLTEPSAFGGSDEDLGIVRSAVGVPLLRKDFHVSESQLLEARRLGASAALVIVRAIEPSRLRSLAQAARDVSLELVFEIRDEIELDRALGAGAEIIGVNNRNLETLEIDPHTVKRIVPLIPPECVAIAESGYSTRDQVVEAARAGADAVLVGSSVSASPDPAAAVGALADVPRRPRTR